MRYFITGTDTDSGKTYVTALMLRALNAAGKAAVGFKPVCCGDRRDVEELMAAGKTLAQAMKVVQEIESLCEVYLKALAVGEPAVLNADEMAAVLQRFKTYGRAARA